MAIMIPGVLLQAGLPAVSEVVSPEGLMVASIAVALLGVAVMMLTRPRTEMAGATESAAGEENPAQVEMPVVETAPPQPPFANVTLAEAARAQLAMKSETVPAEIPRPAAPAPVETAPVAAPAATSHRAAHGASSLMAKVASLLPAGVAMPGQGEKPQPRTRRGASGSQPASRFSRAQQAFLRIPIVLTGRDANGAEFREETCTLILLPQGAVIPMRQKVRAGDRMTLSNPSRQKESECLVYGAHPGQDGKQLVEVDFPEEKNMWPVSFPAWSASPAASGNGQPQAATAAPAASATLDSTGS